MSLPDPRLLCAALVVAVTAAASGCGGTGAEKSAPPSPVVGPIVEVEGPEGDLQAFVVQTETGTVEIAIADDVQYGFDLEHLREHLATRDPVSCTVERRGDRLYALTILDA